LHTLSSYTFDTFLEDLWGQTEGAGQNLPVAALALAYGEEVEPFISYIPGTLFIRHAEDLISNISVMGEISAKGELTKSEV